MLKFKAVPGGRNIWVPGNMLLPPRSFKPVKSAGANCPLDPDAKATHPIYDPVIDWLCVITVAVVYTIPLLVTGIFLFL
jgi:hypothetical protein